MFISCVWVFVSVIVIFVVGLFASVLRLRLLAFGVFTVVDCLLLFILVFDCL